MKRRKTKAKNDFINNEIVHITSEQIRPMTSQIE